MTCDLCTVPTKYTEPRTQQKMPKMLGRGWNFPERGLASETDAIGEQQLKWMQSGRSMRLKWMQSRISSSVQRAARRVQDCSHRRSRGQYMKRLEHFLHGPEIPCRF